eukprot:8864018-Prorocentrum_lima.AAC.1
MINPVETFPPTPTSTPGSVAALRWISLASRSVVNIPANFSEGAERIALLEKIALPRVALELIRQTLS